MTTHRDFWHTFEDVPLVIVATMGKPIHAGLVTVRVELIYNPSDPTSDWTIGNVTLEGYRGTSARELLDRNHSIAGWTFVNVPHAIAELIRHRLTSEWHEHVSNSIAEYEENFQRSQSDDLFDYYRDIEKTG